MLQIGTIRAGFRQDGEVLPTTIGPPLPRPDLEVRAARFRPRARPQHAVAVDNRAEPQMRNEVFPQDSVSEHMTLDQYGAFAAVMNTRYGLGGYSNYFHRFFWDAAFRQGESRLGVMHGYSREQMAGWWCPGCHF